MHVVYLIIIMWELRKLVWPGLDFITNSTSLFFPQNTLTVEDQSASDTSFTLNPEDRREYPDHQAAHRPIPKQQFRQESGHTSLQRDGPRSFLLDLPNFPDLSKADINGQNPNIQVDSLRIQYFACQVKCFELNQIQMLLLIYSNMLLLPVLNMHYLGAKR